MNPHVFAGNPLDRGDTYRRDQAWLDKQVSNAQSRFLPLWQLNVLIQTAQETQLGWVSTADITRLDLVVPPVFLGLQEDIAHFAIDVSQLGDPQHELNLEESWRFEDARTAATALSAAEAGILAQSRAQLDWHRRHQFCSVCGQRTEQSRGGQVRKCQPARPTIFPALIQ